MSQVGQAVSQRRDSGMKSFFIIWVGQVISIVGSGLTGFALGVWMFERTGQATPFALTVLFSNLPGILLAPFAGSIADRWNRRWLMILSDSGDALVTLCAVILVATGRLEVWHVYAIATLSSAFAAFQEPAYMASITMLVPKENLSRANGLVQTAQAVQVLISPLLAGALFGIVGMRGIFAIDFVTYFFAVGALFLVTIPQPKGYNRRRGGRRWHVAQYLLWLAVSAGEAGPVRVAALLRTRQFPARFLLGLDGAARALVQQRGHAGRRPDCIGRRHDAGERGDQLVGWATPAGRRRGGCHRTGVGGNRDDGTASVGCAGGSGDGALPLLHPDCFGVQPGNLPVEGRARTYRVASSPCGA